MTEVQSAAALLRKDFEHFGFGRRIDCDEHGNAMLAVCEAYLAEHPADDDEPCTDDWLRSLGFSNESMNGLTLLIDGQGDPVELYLGHVAFADEPYAGYQASLVQSNSEDHVLVTGRIFWNRRDVRQLLAALGAKCTLPQTSSSGESQ